MNIFKKVEFWIAMAVIVGGILVYLALPKRVSKNETDIIDLKMVSVEQKAILDTSLRNQETLIKIMDKD